VNKLIIFPLLFIFSGLAQAQAPLANLLLVPEPERHAAPAFTIENLRGGDVTLADYKGKLVLLNFWATWCAPCLKEMPSMEKLWQKYKEQGLVVVAVSVDEGYKKRIQTFLKLYDLSFPVLLDPESEVSDLYKVSGIPASFLIDRNGKIISRLVGEDDWFSDDAIQLVEDLLSQ